MRWRPGRGARAAAWAAASDAASLAPGWIAPERLLDDLLVADLRGPEALERPCCLLYSTDTVGGNSGSPVLDSDGDLVAINFDRARGGLMNEFAWSQELSRSIGVDVRLMLWLVGTFDG